MCLTPIRIKARKTINGMVRQQGNQIVPCGKCPRCKERRAASWIFRLLQEEKAHKTSSFVTLTYDPEHVPMSAKGFMTLDKTDFQKFMKRLRKNTGKKSLKYYACGEYGTNTWRPHYHAIMYDVDKDEIARAWQLGHIHIGQVTGASIGYTTKYICKDKRVPSHNNDDRLPEFSLMSKNLGIGYLTPEMVKYHIENLASFVTLEGGYKQCLPRYYRDKIFTEQQRDVMNYQTAQKHKEAFDKAVTQAGSAKAFYRNQFESIKHQLATKRQQQKEGRNKI